MFGFRRKAGPQWVCTVCGYNIIGALPDRCPFCGADSARCEDAGTVSRRYRLKETRVSATVTQLRCAPKLGLEHAAYRIAGDGGIAWIDCPSIFASDQPPADAILFTHKDFIGAANLYRQAWKTDVWLHAADAELSDVAQHSVNHRFRDDIELFGIQGVHIGGHSPGFTVYIWQDVLFVCDYAYPPGPGMKLNPHGNRDATREGAGRLADVLAAHQPATVCGYNYVTAAKDWQRAFARLL